MPLSCYFVVLLVLGSRPHMARGGNSSLMSHRRSISSGVEILGWTFHARVCRYPINHTALESVSTRSVVLLSFISRNSGGCLSNEYLSFYVRLKIITLYNYAVNLRTMPIGNTSYSRGRSGFSLCIQAEKYRLP